MHASVALAVPYLQCVSYYLAIGCPRFVALLIGQYLSVWCVVQRVCPSQTLE